MNEKLWFCMAHFHSNWPRGRPTPRCSVSQVAWTMSSWAESTWCPYFPLWPCSSPEGRSLWMTTEWSPEKLSGNWFWCWGVLERNSTLLFFQSNSAKTDFPFRQLQNSPLSGSKMRVPSVGFNTLTVSVEVGEILMPTSDWNVFPTASGSVVGF